MTIERIKLVAATIACGAVVAGAVVSISARAPQPDVVAGGSGDSATDTPTSSRRRRR